MSGNMVQELRTISGEHMPMGEEALINAVDVLNSESTTKIMVSNIPIEMRPTVTMDHIRSYNVFPHCLDVWLTFGKHNLSHSAIMHSLCSFVNHPVLIIN